MTLLRVLLFCTATLSAADRRVAITIDDLPRGGDHGPTGIAPIRALTEQLLRPFREQKIPVIGFVNQGRGGLAAGDLRQILDLWLDAGADLGNHSYSHLNLNDTPWNSTRPRSSKASRSCAPRWPREARSSSSVVIRSSTPVRLLK